MTELEKLSKILDANDDVVFKSAEDPVPRDRWGRPLIVPPDGGKPVAYTRCTTMAGTIEDTYNLTKWQLRTVAAGLVRRPDLQVSVAAASADEDKRTLDRLMEQALEAGKGKVAANTGTAIHKLSEYVDRKQFDVLQEIPETFKRDLRAYRRIMKTAFRVEEIERFVVQDDVQVGGTFDRLLFKLDDGMRYIGDLKTGSLDFGVGKMACQLGTYANSVYYEHPTKDRDEAIRTPLPDNVSKDRGIIIHLPAGEGAAELFWIDIASGWEAVQNLCAPVRSWRKRQRDLLSPIE